MVYDKDLDKYVKAKKQSIIYNINPIPTDNNTTNYTTNYTTNTASTNTNNTNLVPIKTKNCCTII